MEPLKWTNLINLLAELTMNEVVCGETICFLVTFPCRHHRLRLEVHNGHGHFQGEKQAAVHTDAQLLQPPGRHRDILRAAIGRHEPDRTSAQGWHLGREAISTYGIRSRYMH